MKSSSKLGMAFANSRAFIAAMDNSSLEAWKTALASDNLAAIRRLFETYPEALGRIDDGVFAWGMPALAAAKSVEMAECLLKQGATVETVSQWWAPGFGANEVQPDVARYLISRGASLSPHAAAGIGLVDELARLLDDDPDRVHAQGGDGCQPLHFAQQTDVARLLVDRGADLNARDEDHDSTPVQWRIKDAPEVVRFLLDQGAQPDIFLATGLGDLDLAHELVTNDPQVTGQRIGYNNGAFPGIGHKGRGGTIYQWTLGFNLSPHEVALKHGHESVYAFLFEHTPPRYQLLVACTSGNRELAEAIVGEHATLVNDLDDEDRTLLAKFCWETNINVDAVRLMLDLGFPIDVPEPNHGFMALHNASWCGRPDLVKLLLDRGHPLDRRDPAYHSTALGFAIHSCTEAKRHPNGEFAEVVELLVTAGVPVDVHQYPSGDVAIDAVLERFRA